MIRLFKRKEKTPEKISQELEETKSRQRRIELELRQIETSVASIRRKNE